MILALSAASAFIANAQDDVAKINVAITFLNKTLFSFAIPFGVILYDTKWYRVKSLISKDSKASLGCRLFETD